MKKILTLFLMALCFQNPIYAADQWTKGDPQGTELNGTIDNIIRINQEALDRLVINHRRNLAVIPATSSTITVLQGEISIPNAAGSIVRWRRTTSNTTVSWSDIDTGAEATSTQYYVYATADTDITGIVFKISANSSAPSGATYYRKIGYFYNNSSGNIVNVGNIKDSDAPNNISVSSSSDVAVSASSFSDVTDMEIKFISNGRPITMIFTTSLDVPSQGTFQATFDIDGTDYGAVLYGPDNHNEHTAGDRPFTMHWTAQGIAAGTHTIKVQALTSGSTYTLLGTTNPTVFTAMES